MFNSAENITFKKSYYKKGIQVPKLNLDERKKQWLKIINKNPNLKKHEYKKIGKGLYSWLYKNDNEWFERITPKRKIAKNIN